MARFEWVALFIRVFHYTPWSRRDNWVVKSWGPTRTCLGSTKSGRHNFGGYENYSAEIQVDKRRRTKLCHSWKNGNRTTTTSTTPPKTSPTIARDWFTLDQTNWVTKGELSAQRLDGFFCYNYDHCVLYGPRLVTFKRNQVSRTLYFSRSLSMCVFSLWGPFRRVWSCWRHIVSSSFDTERMGREGGEKESPWLTFYFISFNRRWEKESAAALITLFSIVPEVPFAAATATTATVVVHFHSAELGTKLCHSALPLSKRGLQGSIDHPTERSFMFFFSSFQFSKLCKRIKGETFLICAADD